MVELTKRLVAAGEDVRIFTARVSGEGWDAGLARHYIRAWCLNHLGFELPVTCTKDQHLHRYYCDRAVSVERNTGRMMDANAQAATA